MKKKVLILVFSNLKNDARVRRQAQALQNVYDVTVACFDADQDTAFNLIIFRQTRLTFFRKATASFFLMLRMYPTANRLLHAYKPLAKKLSSQKFDLVIANDIETLPLAFSIGNKPKVLFDAHEYAPRHFEDKAMWRIFFQNFNIWLCKKYIHRVKAMITVGKGLAREYEKHFAVKPTVITNAAHYFNIQPSPVSDTTVRLIHHGIATRSRRLEIMIDLMELLDKRFTLDLMLLVPGSASAGTIQYLEELKKMASRNPRIKFIQPVNSKDVVQAINNYDMGIFLLPPINFNYQNTLPNKLFDFIQARLAIAIGPTPEMAEIVEQFKNGVVSDDFTSASLAQKINRLSKQDIEKYKKNSSIAAQELNAERNESILRSLVEQILHS